MEQKLRELERRIAEVAQSGNYMETRRVGDEHASLERSLRELYDEWTEKSEIEGASEDPAPPVRASPPERSGRRGPKATREKQA